MASVHNIKDFLRATLESGSDADIRDLADDCGGLNLTAARVKDFREAGVLTKDQGLVVALADGTEFQITIVRSK